MGSSVNFICDNFAAKCFPSNQRLTSENGLYDSLDAKIRLDFFVIFFLWFHSVFERSLEWKPSAEWVAPITRSSPVKILVVQLEHKQLRARTETDAVN